MHDGSNDDAIGRRAFLGRLGGAVIGVPALTGLALSRALGAPTAADGEFVTVATRSGRLRGRRAGGVAEFKGIPYGGSVAGAGRFKPPPPPVPWTGVRDALEYGPQSVQPPDPNMHLVNPPPFSGAEDCLFLNVWTPEASSRRRRPVMFYCHGGGFATGDGGGIHHGTDLSRNYDVVVVTINHRLGLLGYLSLSDLPGGAEYADSGNAGMLDIVAALRWVRDNIEAFGGDPHNVMIWGESGGGAKVSTLLAMPPAHGLFHKASIESGPGLRMNPRETATELTLAVLAELGLTRNQVRDLAGVPAARLVEAQQTVGRTRGDVMSFKPVVDGRSLPHHPFDPVAPAISAKIPLMIGTNRDEAVFFLMGDPSAFTLTDESLRARLRPTLGRSTETVIAAYHRSRPDASPSDLLVAIVTAQIFWRDAVTMAERKAAQHGAPVYMYQFAFQSRNTENPARVPMRAMHAIEIPYKFDHPDEWPTATSSRPERYQMAAEMSRAWATFARTGNPSNPGLGTWPAYTLDRRATMVLDVPPHVADDPFREERLVWREIAS